MFFMILEIRDFDVVGDTFLKSMAS